MADSVTVASSTACGQAAHAHVVQNPDGTVFVVEAPPSPKSAAVLAAERFRAAELARYKLENEINSSGYLEIKDYEGSYDCPAPYVDERDLKLQQRLAEKDAHVAAVVSGRVAHR